MHPGAYSDPTASVANAGQTRTEALLPAVMMFNHSVCYFKSDFCFMRTKIMNVEQINETSKPYD